MSKWKQNCQSCHDEIFWNFPPVSREGGGRNRRFQNGIAPDAASSFPRLLAGWRTPQKPPKWNHSAPHTWFSLIFTFRSKNKADSRWRHSQSRTKGQPVEVPTGEGILLPPAGPSTNRPPAPNLGTHTFPKSAEKPAHVTGTSQNYSRQAQSQQHPALVPQGQEAPSGKSLEQDQHQATHSCPF